MPTFVWINMKISTLKLILITGGAIVLYLLYSTIVTQPVLQPIHVRSPSRYRLGHSSPVNLSSSGHNEVDYKNTKARANKSIEGSFYDIDDANFKNNLTVVTAYFNIGSFQKGFPSSVFTNALYRQWMTVFACIENPLIVFVDNDDDMAFFAKVRSALRANVTVIMKIRRNETWSFGLEHRIAEVFKQPGYPHHLPNTVVPSYSAAMHAKYEVMQRAIRENPFQTKYFCWLDIGLFRDLTSPTAVANPSNPNCTKFRMTLPFNFSTDSVAYTEVYPRNDAVTPREIVNGNLVWLCGCYFVGERRALYRWTQEYRNATMAMLASNLMSTDQQVIYAMFNTMKPKTKIQTYVQDGRFNEWFHLGYISRTTS